MHHVADAIHYRVFDGRQELGVCEDYKQSALDVSRSVRNIGACL